MKDFHGMPVPAADELCHLNDFFLLNELSYPKDDMLIDRGKYFPLLTKEQLKVYDSVVNAVSHG